MEHPRKKFRYSLRSNILHLILLHVVIFLVGVIVFHYWQDRNNVQKQIDNAPLDVGEVMVGNLETPWMTNDLNLISQSVDQVGGMSNIDRVQIISFEHQVVSDSNNQDEGIQVDIESTGCVECHQYPTGQRPRAVYLPETNHIRVTTPIVNMPECANCHAAEIVNMGVLLIDVPAIGTEHNVQDRSLVTIAGVLASAITLYLLINIFVAGRLETFQDPLKRISLGDFSTRVPMKKPMPWELTRLAEAFNEMAAQLEFEQDRKERISQLRQKIILEERERIARELHDGMAQILTYINMKATAARLLLQKNRSDHAVNDLRQLEGAAQDLLVDLRMVVLGLRISSQLEQGLRGALIGYSEKFSSLSDLPVDLMISPEYESYKPDPETELEVFRIVQEGLANIHKHAEAQHAWVQIACGNGDFQVVIRDDGKGFDYGRVQQNNWAHFGLVMMEERAESIGATIDIHSEIGSGTTIRVRVPRKEQTHHEDRSC